MPDPGLVEEEFTGQLNFGLWRRVLRYALNYKRYFIPLLIISAITAGCDAILYLAIRGVIDQAVAGRGDGVLRYGMMFIGLVTLQVICVWMFIVFAGKAGQNIGHDIRRDVFARLQELSFDYYDRRPVGWLMARATSDCQRLGRLLAWGLLDMSWGLFMMIALTVVMLVLNWKLALVVFAVVPPLALVSLKFQRLMLHSSRRVRKINSQITGAYNEGISAVRTTKTLVREESNLSEFQHLTSDMYEQSVCNALQSAKYLPIVQTLGAIGAGLALWLGGLSAMSGVLSLGTLILFVNCSTRFFDPVRDLAMVLTDIQSAQASAERVMGLIETVPAIQDSPAVRQAILTNQASPAPGLAIDGQPDRFGEICFRDVSFAYQEGKSVLSHFNLTVRAGQTIALVGSTGCGKTTIVSLLCRFYEPTSGEILLDGVDYRQRSLHWLQSNLGIVLQTPHLFSGTVRENIRFGRLSATDGEIEQAARSVSAEPFILAMEQGYDSQVGQAGSKLSTGQKQLISLARAVLADPKVFVMDEATSSVDTETERLIQHGVETVLKGRTSFVIAHRLSTIRSADRILVIDQGQIVEQGTHHELILQRGRYYELYTNQFTQEKQDQLLHADEASAGSN
jgi:ATP-binding cassette subfamily B protein